MSTAEQIEQQASPPARGDVAFTAVGVKKFYPGVKDFDNGENMSLFDRAELPVTSRPRRP